MFVSDTLDANQQRLAAQVHLQTKLATLSLEDIDHHVHDVTCSESYVFLSFSTALAKQAALDEFGVGQKFYLITSHDTCNNDGERSVYL